MGLFFDDPKPPSPQPPVIQEVRQDWLAVLLGGIFALCTILLTGALKMLGWIFKPLLTYLFTFDGRTREQVTMQMAIFGAMILMPAFFIYKIPSVQDFVSLNSTHTINLSSNGQRIFFPDRSYFVTSDRPIVYPHEGRRYLSYHGYTPDKIEKISPNDCPMVRRSMRRGLHSEYPPVQAEGFEDEVKYSIRQRLSDLKGWARFHYLLTHPEDWLKSSAELRAKTIEHEITSSWDEMLNNWDEIVSLPGFGDSKPFEVKARAREHAIVCF